MPEKPSLPSKSASPTVSMISLGCPRTLVDSEVYLGKLKQDGFRIVEDVDGSDTVIINTCAFVQEAIQESIDTVLQAVKLKKEGRVKKVIVAGCLVQRFKQDVIKELPEVDGFLGVDGFTDVTMVVDTALRGEAAVQAVRKRPQVPHQGLLPREALTPNHYAYLKVSEGCLKACGFCIIPKIKGPLSSRSLEEVVDEAKQLVEERGSKELIVVGQDTSDYGIDRYGKAQIPELLRRLGKINSVKWIRLLYCHPAGISDELVETIRDVPSVAKYLDSAMEHADDATLKRMNRPTTQAHLRERIATLRREIPGIALRTSIVVGYPGETEAEFETLLSFLSEMKFDRLGAFTFSPEEGSAAIRQPNQVPPKSRRSGWSRSSARKRDSADASLPTASPVACRIRRARLKRSVRHIRSVGQPVQVCRCSRKTTSRASSSDSPQPARPIPRSSRDSGSCDRVRTAISRSR